MRIVAEESAELMNNLARVIGANSREKPTFSEAWLVGTGLGEEVESYAIPGGRVSIRNSADGQVDYVLSPDEYRLDPVQSGLLRRILDDVSSKPPEQGVLVDRAYIHNRAREVLNRTRVLRQEGISLLETEERLCALAVRYTVGYGIIEAILQDPHIEDVFIDAPCDRNRVHVTVNGVSGFNSVVRCRTNVLMEETELEHLVSRLCRHSGLPFSESHPTLECDMGFNGTRATAVGRPLSPTGTAIALRRHASRPWTLTRMMRNGTVTAEAAALLSLLVDGRSTMMVCGPRGAGKSSMLSACMFEFPLSQRVLALEDTRELPVEAMQSLGYKVQAILTDDRNGDHVDRTREALRLSLRMGESALVMGEVRGEEVSMLYEGMRTGRAGSTVMGTIHGESASSVYERVVHDLGVSPESFMTTDVVVSMALNRPRGSPRMRRSVKEICETGSKPGEFHGLLNGGAWCEGLHESSTVRRIAAAWDLTTEEVVHNLEARRDLRSFLVSMADRTDESLSPHWTRAANEHLAQCMSAGSIRPERVMASFEELFRRRTGVE